MKKQTLDDLLYLLGFVLKGIVIAAVFTAAMVGLSAFSEVIAEPFSKFLWGIWEAVMGL